MFVIYRKSDHLVVGSIDSGSNPAVNNQRVEVEIQNIVNSELGGRASDYHYIRTTIALAPDKIWSVTNDLEAVQIDNPVIVARERHLNSAINKLTSLGLTSDEVSALIRI